MRSFENFADFLDEVQVKNNPDFIQSLVGFITAISAINPVCKLCPLVLLLTGSMYLPGFCSKQSHHVADWQQTCFINIAINFITDMLCISCLISCPQGPDSHYGTRGMRKVVHESVSSGKVVFQFTYASGNNNGTSVEDGQIPEIIFYT